MADGSNKSSVSIGFLDILGVLFIGLKLAKVITWSWWWVLLPLYGPAAIVISIWIVTFIGVFVASLLKRN